MAAPVHAQQAEDQPVLAGNFFNSPEATHWSWERDFTDVLEIGKGKDTLIYSATCAKLGHKRVAVKVYDKTKVQATKYRAIKREVAMMMYFMRQRLPSVVEYYGAFHDDAHLYIVMEYCGGGDLLEKLLRDKKAMHEKRVAIEVALPCLAILRTLHDMRIIHRDIKLENIFIDDAGRVKLGDFGLTMSMKQESAISPVGTVEYMAPEVVALPPVDLVISGQIKATDIPPTNEKVDIWALGVTIYELVTGRLPFEGKDKPEIKRNITANNLAQLPSFLTPQCQSFIRAMLTYGASERPSCAQLLQHPYITMYCAPPVAHKPATLPNVIALHAYSPGVIAPPGGVEACGATQGGQGGSGCDCASEQPPPTSKPAASCSYRDVLAGAHMPADDTRSPRTPGGSHIPVTVSRNAAATSAQHSPTILAQSGCTSRQDPFASPLGPRDGSAPGTVQPRKISFNYFSPAAGGTTHPAAKSSAPQSSEQSKGWAAAGEQQQLVNLGAGGQAEPYQQTGPEVNSVDRKRGGSFTGNVKSTLRKLFGRRSHSGQHRRLDDADAPLQPGFR